LKRGAVFTGNAIKTLPVLLIQSGLCRCVGYTQDGTKKGLWVVPGALKQADLTPVEEMLLGVMEPTAKQRKLQEFLKVALGRT